MSQDGDMSAGRARRRTTKAVNYAKEQDFSGDEDVFEDEAEEEEKAPIAKRRGRPRKSTSAATGDVRMEQADDDDRGFIDKPIYTEKGYDPSLPPLRDRFPFLPEYEADGSPRIELIIGRRPVVDHHKKDLDDLLDDDHPDETGGAGKRAAARHRNQQEVPSSPVVSARRKKGVKDDVPSGSEDVEYEYLLKFKGKSYLHLAWKTGHDLESMNKSAKTLYRRFLKKLAAGTEEGLEDPDFDPAYAIPQKIVDESEQEVTVELTDAELIEWEKEREKEIVDEDDDLEVKVEGIEDDPDDENQQREDVSKDEKGTSSAQRCIESSRVFVF